MAEEIFFFFNWLLKTEHKSPVFRSIVVWLSPPPARDDMKSGVFMFDFPLLQMEQGHCSEMNLF